MTTTTLACDDNHCVCSKGLFRDKTRQNVICAFLKGGDLMRKLGLLLWMRCGNYVKTDNKSVCIKPHPAGAQYNGKAP